MRVFTTFLLGAFFFSLLSCSGSKMISKDKPESEASVRINLKDGTNRTGIIIKGNSKELEYYDAKNHERENIRFADIKSIERLSTELDYKGKPIPAHEIKKYKTMKNTLLYSGGGLVLGAAVGTAVGIGLYAADQPLLGNVSILVFGGLSAYLFGKKGYRSDYKEAVHAARKARYDDMKAIELEKKKIEALKKEKERLLKQIEKKKKEKKEN